MLGGQEWDADLNRYAPVVWLQDPSGAKIWTYDFRTFDQIDEVSTLSCVRMVQFNKIIGTFDLEEVTP